MRAGGAQAAAALHHIGQSPSPARRRPRAVDRPPTSARRRSASQRIRRQLEQVAHRERGFDKPLRTALSRARCNQRFVALHAEHLARPRRQRQREVAQTAEPVDHALVRPARSSRAHQRGPPATRLMCGLTWVKSVGLNGIVTPYSGKRIGQFGSPSLRRADARCPGPWAAATTARRACAPKSRRRCRSSSLLKRFEVPQNERRQLHRPSPVRSAAASRAPSIDITRSRNGNSSAADPRRQHRRTLCMSAM